MIFNDSLRNMLYIMCSCITFITFVLARSLVRLHAIPFQTIIISICGIVSEAYSCDTDIIITQLNFCSSEWLSVKLQYGTWNILQKKEQPTEQKTNKQNTSKNENQTRNSVIQYCICSTTCQLPIDYLHDPIAYWLYE